MVLSLNSVMFDPLGTFNLLKAEKLSDKVECSN